MYDGFIDERRKCIMRRFGIGQRRVSTYTYQTNCGQFSAYVAVALDSIIQYTTYVLTRKSLTCSRKV